MLLDNLYLLIMRISHLLAIEADMDFQETHEMLPCKMPEELFCKLHLVSGSHHIMLKELIDYIP